MAIEQGRDRSPPGTATSTAADRRLVLLGALLPLLAASCAEPAGCASEPATHPQGQCRARYYQTDFGDHAVTQAMVECITANNTLGGNIVAIPSLRAGIGLRWLDPQTLEVATAPGGRRDDAGSSSVYDGLRLRYVYRDLRRDEPAWAGCGLAKRAH
ncbi:hypothetical protein [Lysobacter enzymogenes]|uniref:hypothetical protein n=1 Tax=Lysobacter enzymogenes TaxID=69 RepID=UPI00089809B2|nr:hypothetical protein [Lysobacter enzymogenes]SDW58256.1 hypothetical protein SAMN05421681_102259 [Lysobacter enzymogenes]